MIQVETFKILKQLPSKPKENEMAYVVQEKKMYQFINGDWEEAKIKAENNAEGLKLSLYEYNKMMYANQKPHNNKQLLKDKEILFDYVKNNKQFYYMLLCKDLSYYTLFCVEGFDSPLSPKIYSEVIECAQDLGEVYDVISYNDYVEIWIKKDEDMYCLFFFGYEKGVVKVSI